MSSDEDSEFARQEGGLLICSPAVQGTWYSGGENSKDRWIQFNNGNRDRRDSNRPKHVENATFARRNMGRYGLAGNGTLIICPWDIGNKFADNAGGYAISFILRRGQAPSPVG
ncbi:hypothetical protein KOI35_18435 [Actinoplanes bogorensis]|uniref:Uncharacterized protein n=1 Tax=Paractinoplanes bogorensis TaxID=1610840 RepID=A0ABS5YPV7_9ACTN|nr:hypothetical protein [Actinoplanes bogorensis]MBU2665489.1 hypothetical protein [Actinoplanes bogorensis]